MDIIEIFESTSFWALTGVGYGAFALMLIVLNKMGQSEIMPMWVKLVTAVFIPIVAGLFSLYAEA